MTDFQTGLQRPAAQQPQRTIKPVLLAVALVLALAWIGAWLLHFSEGTVLAVTLAVLVLGLIAITLPFAFGQRHGSQRAQHRTAFANRARDQILRERRSHLRADRDGTG